MGGFQDSIFHDFWQHDASANSWIQIIDYPGSAGEGAVGLGIGSKGYVGTAGTTNGKEWWQYTPGLATGVHEAGVNDFLFIHPNPLTTSSSISFSLTSNSSVTIDILDVNGRKMKTVLHKNLKVGNHIIELNRETLAPGIYFLAARINTESIARKFLIQ